MLSLAFASLLGGSAFAQDAASTAKTPAKTPAERAQQQTERMTKELTLTSEQVPKVQAINEKYASEMSDMRSDRQAAKAKGDKAAVKDTHGSGKEMIEKKNEELKAVLTPAQYDNWTKIQAKMMERRQDHRQNKPAAPAK